MWLSVGVREDVVSERGADGERRAGLRGGAVGGEREDGGVRDGGLVGLHVEVHDVVRLLVDLGHDLLLVRGAVVVVRLHAGLLPLLVGGALLVHVALESGSAQPIRL